MTNDEIHFNVYCTTQPQQSSLYFKTVLNNDNDTNQWGENEARVSCYQTRMVWKEGSGINCFIYKEFILCFT